MGNLSHALILSLFLSLSSFFTPNNAHVGYRSSHPYIPAPAPSPAATPHHHAHHHKYHAPAVAPAYTSGAASPPPSKPVIPVTPKPPTSKPPTYSPPTVKPPTYPPAVKPPTTKPPTISPVKPPTYSPPAVKPPTSAPAPYSPPTIQKKYVAVQGMVYCKSNCTYSGVDTLLGASPLPGAKVVMRCTNTKYLLRKTGTTDKNGYFFVQAPTQVTTFGAHKCKVYLGHKQKTSVSCAHAAKLNSGDTGAFLDKPAPPSALPTFSLYTVGPFAYEPVCSKVQTLRRPVNTSDSLSSQKNKKEKKWCFKNGLF